MSSVKMFNYLGQYMGLREEVLVAIERVLNSGRLILGPEVQQFEEEFARFLGGQGSCVGVNSGTDAFAIGLMALGIGSGEEVITVANTAVPTVTATRMVGATPVFCNVDPSTCLMDLGELSTRITTRTRAIIPVHLFGNVVDVPLLREIIGGRDIRIVEDCTQAHGAKLRGRMAGYGFLGYTEGSLPHTEALAKTILSLPMHPELPEASVDRVCAELNDVLA
jgi:aminotransferase EvaB